MKLPCGKVRVDKSWPDVHVEKFFCGGSNRFLKFGYPFIQFSGTTVHFKSCGNEFSIQVSCTVEDYHLTVHKETREHTNCISSTF